MGGRRNQKKPRPLPIDLQINLADLHKLDKRRKEKVSVDVSQRTRRVAVPDLRKRGNLVDFSKGDVERYIQGVGGRWNGTYSFGPNLLACSAPASDRWTVTLKGEPWACFTNLTEALHQSASMARFGGHTSNVTK